MSTKLGNGNFLTFIDSSTFWRFSHLGAQAAGNVKGSLALMTPCLPGVVYNRPTCNFFLQRQR